MGQGNLISLDVWLNHEIRSCNENSMNWKEDKDKVCRPQIVLILTEGMVVDCLSHFSQLSV